VGLAKVLRQLARSADDRLRLGEAGRVAAVQGFERRRFSDEFIEALKSD
jgi:hypothetical protein